MEGAQGSSGQSRSCIKEVLDTRIEEIGEMLAARADEYMLAASGIGTGADLDKETITKWSKYLASHSKDHPFLKTWFTLTDEKALREEAARLKTLILDVIEEKKVVDKKNEITLGLNPERRDLAGATLVSLDRDKYVLWRDLFAKATQDSGGARKTPDGVFYYGQSAIDRFL